MRWQGSWACDVCGRPAADHTPAEQQACTAASSTNVYCGACGLAHEAEVQLDVERAGAACRPAPHQPEGNDMTATTPVLEENRAKRYNAAKAEHKLLTAWEKAGRKGARPATPNYDALQAAPAAAKSSKAAKASTPKADRPAVKNVTTEQLRPHVKAQLDAGVTSKPDVIKKLRAAGYRWPTGSVKQIMTELGALGTKPAKASAAKKTSPAKATAAKKAPAKKTVTPITKAQQARKSAAKKTTAR